MPEDLVKDEKPPSNYYNYLVFPLKLVACWEWFEKPNKIYKIITNYVYLSMILLVLLNILISLLIHIYLGWTGFMSSLVIMSESLPILITLFIVAYFATYQEDLYDLVEYVNTKFMWHSASGVTHMTMQNSYDYAKRFAYFYTSCLTFTVTAYTVIPILSYVTNNAALPWMYEDVDQKFFMALILIRHCMVQATIGVGVGQCGVFFVTSSILMCGQMDLLCCSLRNVRYTALLKNGIRYNTLVTKYGDIRADEQHRYSYSESVQDKPRYHYDKFRNFDGNISQYDIYDPSFDNATCSSLEDCARMHQFIKEFKIRFEKFVSPILVVRIIQYTVYLCILLYTATVKFDLAMLEYLFAVVLDMFFHCYYGNQIIVQSDRVSEAAYQCAWITMGVRPRRMLLNILLSSRRSLIVRAGNFLPVDLQTFVAILKTSFSYYTLLVNVNEKKGYH